MLIPYCTRTGDRHHSTRNPAPAKFKLAADVADRLTFSTLETRDPPSQLICSLCRFKPAVFSYELKSESPGSRALEGSVCLDCASNLLSGMEKVQKARSEPEQPKASRPN